MTSIKPSQKISILRKRSTSLNNLSYRNWIEKVFPKRECIQFIPSPFPFTIDPAQRKCGCGRSLAQHSPSVLQEYERQRLASLQAQERVRNEEEAAAVAVASLRSKSSVTGDDFEDAGTEFPLPPQTDPVRAVIRTGLSAPIPTPDPSSGGRQLPSPRLRGHQPNLADEGEGRPVGEEQKAAEDGLGGIRTLLQRQREKRVGTEGVTWIPELHTAPSLTNAFGTIEFQGVSHPHRAQYVRLAYDTHPETIFYLLTSVWGLELPKLLISICGGTQNFDLSPKLARLFHKGLLKAANTTGTWIFTEGLDTGYVKHVGEALSDTLSQSRSTIVAIGIAPWGVVQNNEDLVGKDVTVPYYSVMPTSPNLAPLNSKHSYFLLADDGTVEKYGSEIILRRNLEKYLLHLKNRNATTSSNPPSHLYTPPATKAPESVSSSSAPIKPTTTARAPTLLGSGHRNLGVSRRRSAVGGGRGRYSVPSGATNYHTVSAIPLRKRTPINLYHYGHHLAPPHHIHHHHHQRGRILNQPVQAKLLLSAGQGNDSQSNLFRLRKDTFLLSPAKRLESESRAKEASSHAKRHGSVGSNASGPSRHTAVPIVGLLLNGGPSVAKRIAEYLKDPEERIFTRIGGNRKRDPQTHLKIPHSPKPKKGGAGGINKKTGLHHVTASNPNPAVVPIVVIDGSGGVADIIAYVCSLHIDLEDGTFTDMAIDHISKMIHSCMRLDSITTQLLLSNLFVIAKNKKLVTVYRMGDSFSKDIDQDILCSLLKAHNAKPVDQLHLALSWNRADIARSEIFIYGQRWPEGSLEWALMDALIHDQVDFVKLLIENGVNIRKFLTVKRLEELYNSKYGPQNTLHYLVQDVKKNMPPDYWYTLLDIGAVIDKLMGGVYRCSYLSRKFKLIYNTLTQKSPIDTTQTCQQASSLTSGLAKTISPYLLLTSTVDLALEIFPQPFQDLMVWAVLTQRHTVSLFCWEMGDEPLAKALMATKLFKSMAKEAAEDDLETDMSEKCRRYGKEYAKHSVNLLEKCFQTKPDFTEQLLTYQLENFSNQTCLSLAVAANHMEFIAHSCCQFLLGDLWMGGLRVRKSSALKVLMGIFIPLTILTLEFKTLAQLQLMPQTLEEHINDLEQESAEERDEDTTADEYDKDDPDEDNEGEFMNDDDDYEMNFEKTPPHTVIFGFGPDSSSVGGDPPPPAKSPPPTSGRLAARTHHSFSVPAIKLDPPPSEEGPLPASNLNRTGLGRGITPSIGLVRFLRRFLTFPTNPKSRPEGGGGSCIRLKTDVRVAGSNEIKELIGLHTVPEDDVLIYPASKYDTPVTPTPATPVTTHCQLHGSYHAQLLHQQHSRQQQQLHQQQNVPTTPTTHTTSNSNLFDDRLKDLNNRSSLWRIMRHFSWASFGMDKNADGPKDEPPDRPHKSASVDYVTPSNKKSSRNRLGSLQPGSHAPTSTAPKISRPSFLSPYAFGVSGSSKKISKASISHSETAKKKPSFLFFGNGAPSNEDFPTLRYRKSSRKREQFKESLTLPPSYITSSYLNGGLVPPPPPPPRATPDFSPNHPGSFASPPANGRNNNDPMIMPTSTTVLDARTKFYEFYNAPITKFWCHTIAYFLFTFVYTYVVLVGNSADVLRSPIFRNLALSRQNSTTASGSWMSDGGNGTGSGPVEKRIHLSRDSLRQVRRLGVISSWTEIFTIAFVFTFACEKIREGASSEAYGTLHKIKLWFRDFWNCICLVAFVLFVVGLTLKVGAAIAFHKLKYKHVYGTTELGLVQNQLIWSRFFYALSAIFWYIRILDILSFNKYLGPYVVMIGKMFMDMMVFVLIMVVVMACFGISRYAIRNPLAEARWTLARDVFYQPYWMMYGEVFAPDINPDCKEDGTEPSCKLGDWISPALMALYLLVTNILLVNLLIAVFNHTFLKVSAISQQIWKFRRFNLTIEYEMKPILPPPLIIYCHVYRLFRYFVNRRRLGSRGMEGNFDYGLKLYLSEDDISKLHEFEKDSLDDLNWDNAHKIRSSLENQMFQTMDRIEDFSLRLDDLDQKHNDIQYAISSLNKKLAHFQSSHTTFPATDTEATTPTNHNYDGQRGSCSGPSYPNAPSRNVANPYVLNTPSWFDNSSQKTVQRAFNATTTAGAVLAVPPTVPEYVSAFVYPDVGPLSRDSSATAAANSSAITSPGTATPNGGTGSEHVC